MRGMVQVRSGPHLLSREPIGFPNPDCFLAGIPQYSEKACVKVLVTEEMLTVLEAHLFLSNDTSSERRVKKVISVK